ncbi:MAG: hypothetical protein HY287_02495 [Planctomycetes bacterium]|nr:hypothetical protein [Planctomycetota bacterium]MBI3833179.1 hypothetical protein [Planctomycetota bacterium]
MSCPPPARSPTFAFSPLPDFWFCGLRPSSSGLTGCVDPDATALGTESRDLPSAGSVRSPRGLLLRLSASRLQGSCHADVKQVVG